MAKSKKELLPILLDLHYKYSMNKFEEFYGESVNYSSIEQESYIDLKEMSFEQISRGIKFRKFGRQGNVLTVKMDINSSDYELFLKIFRGELDDEVSGDDVNRKRFNFLHDFEISNIRDLTREEKIRFKKSVDPIDDSDDESEDESEDIEVDDSDLEIMEDIEDIDEIEFEDED